MTETHLHYIFKNNDLRLIACSPSTSKPFFYIGLTKKKLNGKWEKTGEGKNFKIDLFGLHELILVLRNIESSFKFLQQNNRISFYWEDTSHTFLNIKVDSHIVSLDFNQIEAFLILCEHLSQEKIQKQKPKDILPNFVFIEAYIKSKNDRALLLRFTSLTELWVPISLIRNIHRIDQNSDAWQTFQIDSWLVKKHDDLKSKMVINPSPVKRLYRQGDILFKKIDHLPFNLIPKQTGIVAEGELTGHAHVIENGAVYELLNSSSDLFVKAKHKTRIVHDEHLPIALEEGNYMVIRQREYLGGGRAAPIERRVCD
ncbi:MAG: hypothetical protein ACFE8B_12380 [Candidatus Hermodarchaeota archaeon]